MNMAGFTQKQLETLEKFRKSENFTEIRKNAKRCAKIIPHPTGRVMNDVKVIYEVQDNHLVDLYAALTEAVDQGATHWPSELVYEQK
jgi:hypothetical protein